MKAFLKCMISTSYMQLSSHRELQRHTTSTQKKRCVDRERERKKKGGGKSAERPRDCQKKKERRKKTPRDGCTEKPQSGSCDSGIVRLRGKCSGLVLQRAV